MGDQTVGVLKGARGDNSADERRQLMRIERLAEGFDEERGAKPRIKSRRAA
jgi:hypothetical protein